MTSIHTAAAQLVTDWAALRPVQRIPEDVAVATTLRAVPDHREAVAAARAALPPRLRHVSRDAEALLIAAGLAPGADLLAVEAARRALAHMGDRYLRHAAVVAEVRPLYAHLLAIVDGGR